MYQGVAFIRGKKNVFVGQISIWAGYIRLQPSTYAEAEIQNFGNQEQVGDLSELELCQPVGDFSGGVGTFRAIQGFTDAR